jgi:hypothetical protein
VYNRYVNNHEDKVKVEKEAQRLHAAEKYWKKNDYDPIRVRFFDENKEIGFQKKMEEEKNSWGKDRKIIIPRYVILIFSEGEAYNIITKNVINQDLIGKFQHQENNKKKRYEIRYENEKYTTQKESAIKEASDKKLNSKLSYKKFKNIDDRGFDIINLNEESKEYKNKISLKDTKNDWEKLVEKSGFNNTFKENTIYKEYYDTIDSKATRNRFMKERKGINT